MFVEKIEKLINSWIAGGHVLQVQEMAIEDAKALGAVAMFGEKYADVVRVVDVPGVSMELCGGTHCENTGEIGSFYIISESSISSGVRRIEAVVGSLALDQYKQMENIINNISEKLKINVNKIEI